MNHSIKTIAAAVGLAVAGGAQAAQVNDALSANGGDIIANIVSILNTDTLAQGPSLIINTGISADQFFPGSSFSFTSDPGLTSTISSFISSYADVRFWVAGAKTDSFGFDRTTLNTGPAVDDVPLFVTNSQAYYEELNGENGALGAAPGNTAEVPAGDTEHYTNGNLTGFMSTVGLDTDVPFRYHNVTFTGDEEQALNSWRLSSEGVLTYNNAAQVVPLPAAAWLMGSALTGIVVVARRRRTGKAV